jgi:hypothetical protein
MQFSPTSLLPSDSRILKGANGDENCRFQSLGLLLEGFEHECRANGMNVCVHVEEISHFFKFVK